MLVIAACAALVCVGVVIVWRWGGEAIAAPPRWRRVVVVGLAAGLLAGVLAAGAGGRLVMRLLALTSPDAIGGLTEGEATIGRITVGGTLAFIVFAGLPAGVLSGALYVCARPFLPAGRRGGALLGLLLLILVGASIDPLRSDNFDFNLVGPDWLSVLAFGALAAFQGTLVVAIANRLGAPAPAVPPRVMLGGRIAVAAVALLALPVFARALVDILSG